MGCWWTFSSARRACCTAERDAVPELIDQARERGFHPRTLGADKGYDTKACVAELRARKVRPHVTQNTSGRRTGAAAASLERMTRRLRPQLRPSGRCTVGRG